MQQNETLVYLYDFRDLCPLFLSGYSIVNYINRSVQSGWPLVQIGVVGLEQVSPWTNNYEGWWSGITSLKLTAAV